MVQLESGGGGADGGRGRGGEMLAVDLVLICKVRKELFNTESLADI